MIYTDQMMREVRLDQPPSRIVSLVPSITELLFDLGLEKEIAGITKFCIHPDVIFRNKKRIGGTKTIDFLKIDDINPDLIIANKEENLKEDILSLEKKYPVWISDIKSLADTVSMIENLGELTGKIFEAREINNIIIRQFSIIEPLPETPTLYLIWRDPFMAAAPGTFINDMMQRCGFVNVLTNESRYPSLDAATIRELNPSLILLSSEPYPFKEKHIRELLDILPGCQVELVNGEYFSWYGSRLKGSPGYFNSLISKIKSINPEATSHET